MISSHYIASILDKVETNESQFKELKELISSVQMDLQAFRTNIQGFARKVDLSLLDLRQAKSQIRGDIQALKDEVITLKQSLPPA